MSENELSAPVTSSSCLFCNDWFNSHTFTEHLIHCGQVLEPCPNLCNVFVPRLRMRSHLKECPRSKPQFASQPIRESTSVERVDQLDRQYEYRVQVLEQDIDALRSVLNEEIRQRLHLITDVGNLRKQNQVAEDWARSTDETVNNIRECLKEGTEQRCGLTQTLKSEIELEIGQLQQKINQMSIEVSKHQNHLNDNIMQLEEMLIEQSEKNRGKFIEVERFLNDLNEDLKTKFVTNSDLSAKVATLDCEVKGMKNTVCETEDRCDKMEMLITSIDRDLHNLKQNIADLEHHLTTQQRMTCIQNMRGHLIWRIKDYSKKLEEAKQYDTILHSAMFSNKPFGYALRLDIHLNGKGTWKGRNLIACLNVIVGEYDSLLSWPCRLQADIFIRDQCSNNEAQDYAKTINVRKKSDDFIQSNQYFHIPHKLIASRNYLRNDSLFIEVRVLK